PGFPVTSKCAARNMPPVLASPAIAEPYPATMTWEPAVTSFCESANETGTYAGGSGAANFISPMSALVRCLNTAVGYQFGCTIVLATFFKFLRASEPTTL